MPFNHDKIRVGVLRGGPSPEYEVSLKSGANVILNLPEEYEPIDIFISKEGVWHERGLEKNPAKILHRVDVVLNALHGSYGEDGEVQKILESFHVPYTGPRPLPAGLSMNKALSKRIFQENGLKTPPSVHIAFDGLTVQKIKDVYHSLPGPYIVKPSSSGSSLGVYVAHSYPELEEAVVAASGLGPMVIIEEKISGKEATCGVIDDFRGQEFYPLLPVEIRHKGEFFDYNTKYGDAEEICPGNFSEAESKAIQQAAITAHNALELSHYSRSDFIIHPKRGIYILETNSLPGLTDKSLIPKSLNAVGSNIKEFLHHILQKALGR